MMLKIFLIAITFLTNIPIILFYDKVLAPKKSKKLSTVLFSIFRPASTFCTQWIPFLAPYRLFINLFVEAFLVILLFKDKLSKKLFTFLGMNALLIILDYACFIIMQLTPPMSDVTKRYIADITFLILCCIVLNFISNYIHYLTVIDDKKTLAAFVLIPISQVMMSAFLSFTVKTLFITTDSNGIQIYNGNSVFALILTVISVISVVADSVFIRIAYKSAISRQERNQLEILEKENQINYAYYSELQTNADEMRKYRHDVNNIIQTIYVLMNNPNEQGSEDIQKTLKSLEKEINSIKLKKYCSNNLINSILAVNEKRFTAKGIACDIKAAIPEKVGIPELDMCRLFTNILDNAYNAMCDESDHSQTLTLEAHISDGFLYISESNTCPDEQKPAKPGHGLGLKIIKEIAEKHGGFFNTETANGSFSIQIAVKEASASSISANNQI